MSQGGKISGKLWRPRSDYCKVDTSTAHSLNVNFLNTRHQHIILGGTKEVEIAKMVFPNAGARYLMVMR